MKTQSTEQALDKKLSLDLNIMILTEPAVATGLLLGSSGAAPSKTLSSFLSLKENEAKGNLTKSTKKGMST